MTLQISSISKEYLDRIVLEEVSFSIGENDRIGLVGDNGSGKTTLLKIMASYEKADKGSVTLIPGNLSVGYVPQVANIDDEVNVEEGLKESLNLEEDEMFKIYIALDKLGVSEAVSRKFGELSSGQKTKVLLSRLIVQTPKILLLDEPTNHLDAEALEWLESYLSKYKGAFVAVSHDRKFLDNCVNKIFELNDGSISVYGGNYSFYQQQKELESAAKERVYKVFKKRSEILLNRVRVMKDKTQQLEVRTSGADHYVRRKAAKSASRAKSTERMLLKEMSECSFKKPDKDLELSMAFMPKKESSNTIVYLKNVGLSFGKQRLFSNLNFVINKGDRVSISGNNGTGKSSLVKLILRSLNPCIGEIEYGNNLEIEYLPQEHNQLDSELPVIDFLRSNCKIDETTAYGLVKRFLFRDEDLRVTVSKLSSGQKAKLRLIGIMASGANVIILDEPTNYLDIGSREALESAIRNYEGSLIVISHDRYFLKQININKSIKL